jgi:hypothetical protein
MEDVAREGWHQDRVGPAKNSDDREEDKNGPDPDVIPNVAKALERLGERAARRRPRGVRWQKRS